MKMTFYRKVGKRAVDLFLSSIALVLLSPLFLLISLAVIIDSGWPVLFVQERVGRNERVFLCYKFRTMKNGIPMVFNSDGSTQVLECDQRLTRIGVVLRESSLDELPQLVNVFLGGMSLVGPRPDLPCQIGLYDEVKRQRYSVKPGITGLAQVNGRNCLTVSEKVQFDLEYIMNCSLLLDVKILLKTPLVIYNRSSVYSYRQPETPD